MAASGIGALVNIVLKRMSKRTNLCIAPVMMGATPSDRGSIHFQKILIEI